jgi:hypothetical protein
MRTVELLTDPRLDEQVRAVWRRLHDAWWTPHLSLALRVRPEDQHRYPRELGTARGRLITARSYDSASRTVTDLAVA